MWTRKLLLGAVASASIGFLPLPAAAAEFFVDVAPPALRHEVVPTARSGYVWVPGYWDWRANRHVWAKGHWERERRGYYYHPNRWEQRDGRWVLQKGRWDRARFVDRRGGDRDRDGVPNRVDRDRDGDGVRNRYDSAPNNPRRQ